MPDTELQSRTPARCPCEYLTNLQGGTPARCPCKYLTNLWGGPHPGAPVSTWPIYRGGPPARCPCEYLTNLQGGTPQPGAPVSTWQIYRGGPHPGAPVSTWPIYRGGPPARGLLWVPDGWTTEKDPRRGNSPNAWMGGATEKPQEAFWSPATRSLNKDPDRAVTPAAEAVHVPAHLALPGSPQGKQLHQLHAQVSLGQSCHRPKKVFRLRAQGHFGPVRIFATL